MLNTLILPYHPLNKDDFINYAHDDISLAEPKKVEKYFKFYTYSKKVYKLNGIGLPPCYVLTNVFDKYCWRPIDLIEEGEKFLKNGRLIELVNKEQIANDRDTPFNCVYYQTPENYYLINDILIHTPWKT